MDLVITSFGASLSRAQGMFEVETEKGSELFSPEQVESICLTTACTLTTDAILLALEHQIPLTLVDRSGKPAGRFWSVGYPGLAQLRRQQARFDESPAATDWLIDHLQAKTERQISLLGYVANRLSAKAARLQKTQSELSQHAALLDELRGQALESARPGLRGREGNLSRLYFSALGASLPEPYGFERRSRRPAQDLFNAALNYAYGMLYRQVEAALLAVGLDPYLPLLHRDAYQRPGFVYDFMEAYRPWADRIVVSLCLKQVLSAEHLEAQDEGVWLNPAGRELLIEASNGYWKAHTRYRGRQERRRRVLYFDARQLARNLIL